ncbi:hypothetical protein [Curtobacterium sp. 9128]|uniref:hypothetical protein n=1 Tax=Curtobacterium sp. 9128 TaxID=1793722 RepID=UPI00119E4A74|nr:hypothetical protein [Curtobacterium sp. 9128]
MPEVKLTDHSDERECQMNLHDNDIPGEQTPVQRFEFGKSVVLGIAVIVLGGILAVVGIVGHHNPIVPIVAVVAGVLIVVFDLSTRRSRRERQGR